MSLVRLACISLFVAAAFASVAGAAELGDKAPALSVEKWIKGGPVDVRDGKHVYVVEFWATWCGPCKKAIPHLTELQKKYKDKGVVVVGVSVDEATRRKTRDKVEPFVKDQGAKMEYVVALDSEERATDKAYMDAFLVDGIPNAFVVDKQGRIVWQGHPNDGLEEVIDAVLAGKHDLEKARAADKKRFEEAQRQTKTRDAVKKYFELAAASDKPEGGEKAGRQVFAAIGNDDADLLNMFAWDILTRDGLKYRDLKLALDVAKAANTASKGENPAILDTYAKALWDNGQKAEAIKYQKKAVALASEDMKAELEDTLRKYESEVN